MPWLLFGLLALAAGKAATDGRRRRVFLRANTEYRFTQRWRRLDDATFERLWDYFGRGYNGSKNLTLVMRTPSEAVVFYDQGGFGQTGDGEDAWLDLPQRWWSLRDHIGETRAEARIEDARPAEV